MMAVRTDGTTVGSVSGGCVESAVTEECLAALQTGEAKALDFGALDDAKAWEVGLSCGGQIVVQVDPLLSEIPVWRLALGKLEADEPCVLVTWLDRHRYELWQPGDSCSPWSGACQTALESGVSGQSDVEGEPVFLTTMPARENLIVVGAVHIALPLVQMAKALGFHVTVIEPRSQLADLARFPTAPDRLVNEWPGEALTAMCLHSRTFAALLTHDPKIDNDALAILLKSGVGYIGALGSRTTHAKRLAQLAEIGFSPDETERIHGPIGLSIGAKSPEEIALSILAEIVQVRNQR